MPFEGPGWLMQTQMAANVRNFKKVRGLKNRKCLATKPFHVQNLDKKICFLKSPIILHGTELFSVDFGTHNVGLTMAENAEMQRCKC